MLSPVPAPELVRLGRKALSSHAEAILAESEGVMDGRDPEFIHRMRVGIRRFRSVLDSIPTATGDAVPERWCRILKRTGRKLGSARDLDVQIEALDAYSQDEGRGKDQGIARLRLRLAQKRQRLQPRIKASVKSIEAGGLREDVLQALRREIARTNLAGNAPSDGNGIPEARAVIVDRVAQLLAYHTCVKDESREEELHDMRIAAKRLRYTMEAFQPLFKKSIKSALGVVKELQSLLGDIHDCDTWNGFLPRFLRKEEARTLDFLGHARGFGRITRGVEAFRSERVKFREQRLSEFRALWAQLKADEFWAGLCRDLETIDTPAEPEQANGDGNFVPTSSRSTELAA